MGQQPENIAFDAEIVGYDPMDYPRPGDVAVLGMRPDAIVSVVGCPGGDLPGEIHTLQPWEIARLGDRLCFGPVTGHHTA